MWSADISNNNMLQVLWILWENKRLALKLNDKVFSLFAALFIATNVRLLPTIFYCNCSTLGLMNIIIFISIKKGFRDNFVLGQFTYFYLNINSTSQEIFRIIQLWDASSWKFIQRYTKWLLYAVSLEDMCHHKITGIGKRAMLNYCDLKPRQGISMSYFVC